jgi:uncharacterized membrane protein
MRGATRGNGRPAFVERELRHFADVRTIFRVLAIGWAAGLAVLLLTGLLRASAAMRAGARDGARLATVLFSVLAVAMAASFDLFFEGFHTALFAEGSWRLPKFGTVRSLFPDAFWAIMGGAVATLVLAQAFALAALLRRRDGG